MLILLSKEPVRLIFIALLVASPIAYWAMQNWLENYGYKVNIAWWIFLFAGAGTLLVAVLTISIQTVRAAISNPAKSLKHE